jgi:hypothetical protein
MILATKSPLAMADSIFGLLGAEAGNSTPCGSAKAPVDMAVAARAAAAVRKSADFERADIRFSPSQMADGDPLPVDAPG